MADRASYYSFLDPVRFAQSISPDIASERAVGITGILMLDLLIGDITPLLSQAQAFDHPLLLAQFAEPSTDSVALLGLFRRGQIQVGIFDSPSLRRPSHENRFTLLNAFCSALAQPDFVFSGWPEFDDVQLRQEVLSCLEGAPDKIKNIGNDKLVAKITGLYELDSNLRQGNSIRRAKPASVGLHERVRKGLTELVKKDQQVGQAIGWLLQRAARLDQHELETRSLWYRLLDEMKGAEFAPAATDIQSMVDGAYNAVVAQSLGATGTFSECSSIAVAEALAALDPNGASGERLVKLAIDPRRQEWLTWAKVADLVEDFEHLRTPARRFELLTTLHADYVATTEVSRKTKLSLKLVLPSIMTSALVSGSIGVFGEALGGVSGAAVGAVIGGVVSLLGSLPVMDRVRIRWEDKVRRQAAQRWEATVTTGSASWLTDL